ncbi:uncharacterized protein LOC116604854 [Nematostella vectensis]|uniref:uncharacterized protein LOC116604854 n=1 Tax=Nematostella vectensis TaxID=45351 RepID=UPI00207748DD|nr:uncharacterized protein LOC116604854 [Nematostella vectensis]
MERFKCSRRNQTWMCCLFLVCNLSFLVPSQADEDVRISNSEGFDALVGALSGTLDLNEPAKDKTSSSSESLQSILGLEEPADQAHRRRRSIVIRNGPSGRLSVQGLTASQSCDGITVSWIPPSVPYSSMYEYTNSEFKYYNIYRSTSFFNDVTGMQPYATGQHEEALRRVQVTSWTDRYPVAMTTWFYAVTVVDGSGQEGKQVTAQKVQRIPAVQKEGSPVIMMPSLLQGRVLHHSMAYNPNRNEYFVAFDLDINGDNRPDRLYGVRLNPSGVIMDKTILNFTANIPGWVGGEQGWPSAVFNPRHNEFFVLFHFRSMRHFFRKFVILGQRVMSAKTERAAAPTLVVKATSNNGQMKADAKEPKLLYNPQTGGYVASVIIAMPKKDVASLFLDRDGRMQASAQICSFKGHAYEHNLFLDSKRNEFFFTCLVETRGAKMLNVKMENKPYVLVMTKKNATGGHASNIPNPETKNMVSFTTKRDGHVEGYYSEKKDRLMLFWEDTVNGRHVIRKAIVGLSTKFFAREVKQEVCTVTKEVRTPVPLPLPLSGSHYLLWQERDRTSWSIGGQLLKGSFNLANREQRFPVVVHNMRSDMGFVVWQEVFGNQVKLVGRHFQYSSSYTCTPQCTGDQQCYQQNTCAKPITGCSSRPCSHVCKTLPDGRYSCACPKYMHLAADGKTCTGGLETCFGRTPLKDSSNNNLFCGRGAGRRDCPAGSFCHIHPTDRFAVCCKGTNLHVSSITSIFGQVLVS